MINKKNLRKALESFSSKDPFPYSIIDDFLPKTLANSLADEFPKFNSDAFNGNYDNQIELKKTCNVWDRFPKNTYNFICYLNSEEFLDMISFLTKSEKLKSDPGLHGGGWHCYPSGGRLNPHLDYYLHPKLDLVRKFNLLIYLTPDWEKEWGGHLGLWSADKDKKPLKVEVEILPIFNRAVLFDTTMMSWHGLSSLVKCPKDITRNSIAVYYMTDKNLDIENQRRRALFNPTIDQQHDEEILNFIKRRSSINSNDVSSWQRK